MAAEGPLHLSAHRLRERQTTCGNTSSRPHRKHHSVSAPSNTCTVSRLSADRISGQCFSIHASVVPDRGRKYMVSPVRAGRRMDGVATLPFIGSHDLADRNRDWHLAVCHRLANFSSQYVGQCQPDFDQSQFSHLNLWRHFDDLRSCDLSALSERKSDSLHGGIMSGSLQNLSELDRVIHEPARLTLVALLSSVESADFLFLLKESGLTKGNLSVHLSRLDEVGYLQVEKTFRGRYRIRNTALPLKGKPLSKNTGKNLIQSFGTQELISHNVQKPSISLRKREIPCLKPHQSVLPAQNASARFAQLMTLSTATSVIGRILSLGVYPTSFHRPASPPLPHVSPR